MATVSLCMIVKNEEDVLGRCLESVKGLVEEIIIVDTGSTDKTKEIAANFTDKIYDFKWIKDFSAARNFAFSKASCEYSMWLDADDVITEKDSLLFTEVKSSLTPDVNVVMMKYNTGFDKNGNVTFSYFRERLIKAGAGMAWKGEVHEVIEPKGKIIYSDCAVTHKKEHPSDPDRNLYIFYNMIKNGKELDPRQQFYYGRELYYHKKYTEALEVFDKFLEEGKGWTENVIDACCHSAYCCYGLGQEDKALGYLFRSFVYDLPRAEVCCDIGKHYIDHEKYTQAIYWYNIALTSKRDDSRGGFYSPDCYNYIPCIQLCVCHSRLGDIKKAIMYNELAAEYKPESEAVLFNRKIFSPYKARQSDE